MRKGPPLQFLEILKGKQWHNMKNFIPVNSITEEMDKFFERHKLLKPTKDEINKIT